MYKPAPKKHDECQQCLEHKPLLFPVGFAPGFPIIVWSLLCFQCRMEFRADKNYCWPETDIKHHSRASARAIYKDYIEAHQ